MKGVDPRLSVLIVSYNVAQLLSRCLASLRGADEVIVVDNDSRDGTVDRVRAEFPDVRLFRSERNLGFSAALNQAASAATGDLFLLLNPDTELAPGTIEEMKQAHGRRPNAALGFRQVDAAGVFQLSFGPGPSLTLELARMVVQRRLDGGDGRLANAIDGLFAKPRRVPWVSGACVLVRRVDFERVGGFDDSYFLYFEDIDFCLRLRGAGIPTIYDPGVTVVHHRGQSAKTNSGLASRAYRESQAIYWRRYRGALIASIVERYQRLRGVATAEEA